MGRYVKEAFVKVGLVGLDEEVSNNLIHCLSATSTYNPGRFQVTCYDSLNKCWEAVKSNRINAVCIGLENFDIYESTSFVCNIRVAYPLVPFCLVGTDSFLKLFPGYERKWKVKFRHYFKLRTDISKGDFDENGGVLRDLFLADFIKCKALGNYGTTPGSVVRLRAPRPYGFWLTILAALVIAVVGGSMPFALERVFKEPSTEAEDEVRQLNNGKRTQQDIAPEGTEK